MLRIRELIAFALLAGNMAIWPRDNSGQDYGAGGPTLLSPSSAAANRGWGSLAVEPSYDQSFMHATAPPPVEQYMEEAAAPPSIYGGGTTARPASFVRFLQAPPNYQTPPSFDLYVGRPIDDPPEGGWWYDYDVVGRAYYINDQRIEWTGQEATFGVEGVLAGAARRRLDGWEWGAEAELFINQPFDRNILVDSKERVSYRGNFEIEPLQISQLFLSGRYGDLFAALGKMATPFGRTYFPLYLNDLSDAPFIRSEAILWRETGLLMQYDPANWVFTAAITNGGLDRDTNSSKAFVGRLGYGLDWCAVGTSIKWQDGVSSEGQKIYKNHIGIDAMVRNGRWMLSGEAIYDQHGFRRPGFDPLDITWGRSIYYRDLNEGMYDPIEGFGYYVNLGYHGDLWTVMLNYGEYYPEHIGVRLHDITNRRAFIKIVRSFSVHCELYSMLLLENDVPEAQAGRLRQGAEVLAGFQFTL